jgi:hypothetical protein
MIAPELVRVCICVTRNGEDQPFIEVLQPLRYNMCVGGCGCGMRVCVCCGCVRVLWVERERERDHSKETQDFKSIPGGGVRVILGKKFHNGGRERQRQNISGPKMLV